MNRQTPVRRVKGLVISHSVTNLAGCPPTSRGLAQYGDALRQRCHPRLAPRVACNHKWAAHWTGSVPREDCLLELQTDLPALQLVVTDPLWDVLEALWDKRRHTDHLAQTLHLASGNRLPDQGPVLMRRLCGCPDWRNLGCVLGILGSTSMRFRSHRRWLRTHFLTYLLLVCLAEPCCHAREPLFEVLNALHERAFFEAIEGWPQDFAAFERLCQALNRLADWLRDRQWICGWDLHGCTFVQLLQWDHLRRSPPKPLFGRLAVEVEVPTTLAKRVESALRRHRQHRFTLEV